MAIRDLFFTISARDQTGGAFKGVKDRLRDVEGAARSVGERLNDMGRRARNVGAGLSVAVTAPILLGLRQSLSLYQVQERAEAQVAQAIRQTGAAAGFTAEQLFAQATALQELSEVGDEQILSDVTAQLLTFGNISGEVFSRAQAAALDLSATLGSDLRSQTIQLGKALNDPVRGISALGEAGIQFTESQRQVIESLVETGRVAEAQGLILDEIAAFYGGQASAQAATLSGQLTQLNNAFGDLNEELGAVVAEVLPPLISGLRSVIDAFSAAPDGLKRFAVVAGGLAAVIGPAVAAVGLLAVGVSAIGAPVAAAIAGITALTAAVIAFWPEIEATATAVYEGLMAVPDMVANAAKAAYDAAKALVKQVFDVIRGGFNALVNFVDGVARRIVDAFQYVYDAVVGNSSVPDLVDGVLAEFMRLDRGAAGQAEATADTVAGVFDDLSATVAGAFQDMVRSGDFSLRSLGRTALDIGAQVAGGIAGRGVDTLTGAATAALGGLFGGGGGNPIGGGGIPRLPSFDHGADFMVGGRGGVDRNLVSFMASRGERVTVTPRGGGGGAVNVVIQTPDPAAFKASRSQVAATVARAAARGSRVG